LKTSMRLSMSPPLRDVLEHESALAIRVLSP